MADIVTIPADGVGNLLFLKDVRRKDGRIFIKYRSTFNDVPFQEVELHSADGGINYVITGGDGTTLWRFSKVWIEKLD